MASILGLDDATYSLVKKGIDASVQRGKAIANNIANVNTKDYKKFNVVFEENLNKESDKIDLRTTRDKHISLSNNYGDITVERDESTSMNNDGNNVDIEVEKVNQAANSLKYQGLVQQANSKLSLTKYIISGGN